MTVEPDGILGGADLPASIEDLVAALGRHLAGQPEDIETLGAVRRLAEVAQSSHDTRPLDPITWAKAATPVPRQWIIRDWLPLGAVTILAGPGGIGKSRWALQLAGGVASGGDMDRWVGGWTDDSYGTLTLGNALPREGAPVLYATWEDSAEEIFRRLAEVSGPPAPWVTPTRLEELHIVDMAGRGPLWGPDVGRHILTAAGMLAVGHQLRDLAERLGAILVILDPLAAVYAGDENARALVRAFMADWDAWARAADLSVLILSHPPKSGAAYAGSTDWQAAARAMWQLEQAELNPKRRKGAEAESGWRLAVVKSNYGPKPQQLRLEWDAGVGELRWEVAGLWPGEAETSGPVLRSKTHTNGILSGDTGDSDFDASE